MSARDEKVGGKDVGGRREGVRKRDENVMGKVLKLLP